MQAIDQQVRKRFESDWLSGRHGLIEDYLPPADSALFLPTLEDLVCAELEFTWLNKPLHDASTYMTLPAETPTRPTLVEDYLQRFPKLNEPEIVVRLVEQEVRVRVNAGSELSCEEYQRRFPTVRIEPTLFARAAGSLVPEPQLQISDLPRVFGSYILLSELGRGGMGTVFRARQSAAERDVAIKIAHVSGLSARESSEVRLRFQSEARAAAAIDHDNVVPVFDVGVLANEPYFAMRLVEGGDLKSLTKTDLLPPRRAAQYMLGAARGIAAAHQAGLLHRDVKPQNILVDATTDRAMIADFGLARLAEVDTSLTRTGQILGTPQFMSPEQFRDSRLIDARADIYGLGATLYYLLTGRPPFQAADPSETMRQILNEEPVAPRLANRNVDPDLDTICLKCLEKEPSNRYHSASLLADDLARFLDGKPVNAKPISSAAKLVRWCRRNRALAIARGLLLLSLVGVMVAIIVGWRTTLFENQRFQSSSQLSREALNELYVLITDDPLLSLPGLESTRKSMLSQSLEYYRKLLALDEQDEKMHAARAFALSAMGDISLQLGQSHVSAETHFRRALDEFARLRVDQQSNIAIYQARSNALIGLAQCASQRGDLVKAQQLMQEATEVRKRWSTEFPDDFEARRKLANSLMNEGLVMASAGNLQRADVVQQEAKLLREALLKIDATSPKLNRDIARGEFNLAMLDLRLERPQAAIDKLERCEELFRDLVYESAVDWRAWRDLATTLITHGNLLADKHGPEAKDEVATLVSDGLETLRALISLGSDTTSYAVVLMEQYQQGIEALMRVDAIQKAHAEWGHLLAEIERLKSQSLDADVAIPVARMSLWSARQGALLALGLEGRDAAITKLRDAIAQWHLRPKELAEDVQLTAAFAELTQLEEHLRQNATIN